jgi:hypothetical protein
MATLAAGPLPPPPPAPPAVREAVVYHCVGLPTKVASVWAPSPGSQRPAPSTPPPQDNYYRADNAGDADSKAVFLDQLTTRLSGDSFGVGEDATDYWRRVVHSMGVVEKLEFYPFQRPVPDAALVVMRSHQEALRLFERIGTEPWRLTLDETWHTRPFARWARRTKPVRLAPGYCPARQGLPPAAAMALPVPGELPVELMDVPVRLRHVLEGRPPAPPVPDNIYRIDNVPDAENDTIFIDHLDWVKIAGRPFAKVGETREAYWRQEVGPTAERVYFHNRVPRYLIAKFPTHAEALAFFEHAGDMPWSLTDETGQRRPKPLAIPFARWYRRDWRQTAAQAHRNPHGPHPASLVPKYHKR